MKSILLVLSLCAIGSVSADIVYDINYEPPGYTNGQQVGGGSGETISDSINGFTSQGLLIHDGGSIAYYAPSTFTSGVHLVTWEFAIPVQQGSTLVINSQLGEQSQPLLFDTTVVGGPNVIEYGSGFPQRPNIPYSIGQAYSFQVLMDLDANYYSFWIDGALLENTVAISADTELSYVAFSQNQSIGLQAGIDNFRWEIVPEPASMLLILFGGSALYLARRRQHS